MKKVFSQFDYKNGVEFSEWLEKLLVNYLMWDAERLQKFLASYEF
jgi:hypothetical protein